ncbi:MAG TPA: protein kinase [Vicinamibacterales bacterium]|nr:protein kinase [Vicinamibacterales bacterium]
MKTIGRYELKEKLGEGGMGVVYRAFDPLLDRIIALKLISASVEGNTELRERFFREARAAGQLTHKSIITIHDLGEHEGQPYLAMEYLEGEDLHRRLSHGARTGLGRKLDLAIEICEGLEYAHARGVVHRDIKPANIFITDSGGVKLLDFGLARLVTSDLTHSNMMMGTLNYMAPEQVRGERADQRSDIFSMGVVLYEMLGGRKAFEGDSFASTMYKILQEVPEPLLKLDPTLPAEAARIVDRALAKSRDERYQHIGEMLRDLSLLRQQVSMRDSPAGYAVLPGTPSVASRPGSGGPVAGHPGSSPPSVTGSDAVTGPGMPSPLPTPAVVPSAQGVTPAAPAPARGSSWIMVATVGAIGAAAILGGFGIWLTFAPAPETEPAAPDAAVSQQSEAEVGALLQQAALALQAGDYATARRQAEDVLARVPNNLEARRLRDRVHETEVAVESGLREARAHAEAGRYEEATKAAGGVLAIAPTNAEAQRLMQESAARSRGRSAQEARARMAQAKTAAGAAKASALAAAPYGSALAAEQEAQRLLKAGRTGDATVKFYEASGLYRSAELAARAEASARADRARADASRQQAAPPPQPAAAEPKPALPPAPAVQPGAPTGVPGAVAKPERPIQPPSPPVSKPASPPVQTPAPPPAAAPPMPSPEQLIGDLLGRYRAALESRNLENLKRLWPTLGGAQQTAIANEFQYARRIDVEIENPRITVADGTATATFDRRYELVTVEGQRLRTNTRTTMTLRRAGSQWVIDDIRFEPLR